MREGCTCGLRDVHTAIYGTEFPCSCNIMRWERCPQCPKVPSEIVTEGEGMKPTITIFTIDEARQQLGIEVESGWSFEKNVEKKGDTVHPAKELKPFMFDAKCKTWFYGAVQELEKLRGMPRDEAVWFVIKYVWRSNIRLDHLTAADLSNHMVRIVRLADAGDLDPLSPAEYRRTVLGITNPTYPEDN